jgi:hypothetical protein
MTWIVKILGLNWKSNLIAVVAFLGTVPSIVTAIGQFINHQPVDWHAIAGGLIVALLAYVSKDASNQSTQAQVDAATAKVAAVTPEQVAAAEVQVKTANLQAAGNGK